MFGIPARDNRRRLVFAAPPAICRSEQTEFSKGTDFQMPPRMLPEPTPEPRHFWEGCKEGEFRLQRCTACNDSYFPPRPFCPKCGNRDVEVYKASGKGVLWSYVINHRP